MMTWNWDAWGRGFIHTYTIDTLKAFPSHLHRRALLHGVVEVEEGAVPDALLDVGYDGLQVLVLDLDRAGALLFGFVGWVNGSMGQWACVSMCARGRQRV